MDLQRCPTTPLPSASRSFTAHTFWHLQCQQVSSRARGFEGIAPVGTFDRVSVLCGHAWGCCSSHSDCAATLSGTAGALVLSSGDARSAAGVVNDINSNCSTAFNVPSSDPELTSLSSATKSQALYDQVMSLGATRADGAASAVSH